MSTSSVKNTELVNTELTITDGRSFPVEFQRLTEEFCYKSNWGTLYGTNI